MVKYSKYSDEFSLIRSHIIKLYSLVGFYVDEIALVEQKRTEIRHEFRHKLYNQQWKKNNKINWRNICVLEVSGVEISTKIEKIAISKYV